MDNKQAMMQALMTNGGNMGAAPPPQMASQPQQPAMPTPEQIEQAVMILQQAGMMPQK